MSCRSEVNCNPPLRDVLLGHGVHAGNRLAGILVGFADRQARPPLVLNRQSRGLAGEQFNVIFPNVQDMIGSCGRFLDGIDAGFQI